MNHILEKLSRDGWTITIHPRKNGWFHVVAEKTGTTLVEVQDEYSPINAIKILDEIIYNN